MAIPVRKTKQYGKSGKASVSARKDNIQVSFEDGVVFHVAKEDAPDYLQSGEYFVTMDIDNVAIRSVRLPRGSYFAKFSKFTHKEGDPPTYREVPFQPRKANMQWDTPAHLEFTAIFKIVDNKKFENYEAIYSMWYVFADYDGTGEITCVQGRGVKRVEGFLDAVGVDMMKDDIPYSENVLPALQEMIWEKDKKVVLIINEGGWVEDITPAPGE